MGSGLFTARASNSSSYVWVTRGGQVTATGLAKRSVASNPADLAEFVDRANLP